VQVNRLPLMRSWEASAEEEAARAFGQSAVLAPQLLEPCGLGGGVPDGELNVPMAEIILDEPSVGSLIGKSEATRMPQHLGVY
jgi:hypothetical protein